MKTWTFQEWLGILTLNVLFYLLAFRPLVPEVSTTFRDIAIIIAYYFFRKAKP